MKRLLGLLDELTERREVTWGYQVAVVVDGEVVLHHAAGVDGLARPMTTNAMTCMYCSAKSLNVVAAAQLVSAGELSLDDRVGDLVAGCSDAVARIEISDLLTHRSGITRPTLIEATTLAECERLKVATRSPLVLPPLDRDETRYTEASEWILLGACIAAAADTPLLKLIESTVVGRLSLEAHFDINGDAPERRRVGVSLRQGRSMPLLLELSDRFAFSGNPGYGGHATMLGQALLIDALRRAAVGSCASLDVDEEVAAAFIAAGPERWDRTFQRRCSLGLGFMTQLRTHGFGGALSDQAFGQAGLTGMTTVVSDPSIRMSAAIHLNGMVGSQTTVGWLRPVIWSSARGDVAA